MLHCIATAMPASKEEIEITIGPYKNIQEGMCLEESDLSVGSEKIAKGTDFDES